MDGSNGGDDYDDLYSDLMVEKEESVVQTDMVSSSTTTTIISQAITNTNNNDGDISSSTTNSSIVLEQQQYKLEIEELKKQNNELKQLVTKLNGDKANLQKVNEILMKNISCLFKTATIEIQRKDKEIESLRDQQQSNSNTRYQEKKR